MSHCILGSSKYQFTKFLYLLNLFLARHDAPFAEQHDIQRIKDCISVLFVFHRKPIFDTEFVTNIRQWTVRLVCK